MVKKLNSNVHILENKGYHFEFYKDYFIYKRKTFFKDQYINVNYIDIDSIEFVTKSFNLNYTYTYTLNLNSQNTFKIIAQTYGQLMVLKEAFAIINELRSRAIIELLQTNN